MKKFLFLTLVLFSQVSLAQLVDKILVVVNSEIILDSDLRKFEQKLARGEMLDDLLLFGQGAESLRGNRKLALEYLINEKIIETEIKRLNLSVTFEKVDQEIKDLAKKNGVSKPDLLAAVKAQGMNQSDYQDFIKNRIERQSLIEQEVSSKIRVSDEEVMSQYVRMNPQGQTGTFEYQLSHILFNPRKGGAQAAKDRAEAVLKKLKAGSNFEELAEQNSEDANFSNGGALGSFKAGEFGSEMEKAIQNLEVGQFSAVVQTKAGFHILKVLGKKVVTDPKYESEKERIRSQLFEKSFQKHFKTWLESKKEDSFIKVN